MYQRGGYWDEADQQTQAVERRVHVLDTVLVSALRTRPHLDFEQFKRKGDLRPFDPGALGQPRPAPRWEDFAPPPPTGRPKLWGSPRYDRAVLQATEELERARAEYDAAERQRQQLLAAAERRHAERLAVQRGLDWVLRRSSYPSDFPRQWKLEFLPTGKQLIVRYQLPNRDVIPTQA